MSLKISLLIIVGQLCFCLLSFGQGSWPSIKAEEWYAKQAFFNGANFSPSTAVNQLEMWQADTFDLLTIDREFGYAEKIGMNCARVYLHHVAWQIDPPGFKKRVNEFLEIADRHKIHIMFVLFDDCWRDTYKAGKQPEPIPSVHNSQWLKDPGGLIDREKELMDTLETYVKDIIGTFKDDKRLLMWDLYNEPGHFGHGAKSWPLLRNVVKWVREVNPSQPITVGVWNKNFADFNKFQIENSDVITFHNYQDTVSLKDAIDSLQAYGKPIICTEYMKRPNGSTFQNCLPIFKRNNVGAISWGLVAGKTQTNYPQRNNGGEPEPAVWYHDIFRKDGTPFDKGETDLIKEITRVPKKVIDGPYVFGHRSKRIFKEVVNGKVKSSKAGKTLAVHFAEHADWNFKVVLADTLVNENAVWPNADKVLALSDIEGEFGSFRNLLLGNKVTDEKYNWTFGKGNLVICGDLFDRGWQVTEQLWLLYKLDQEAKIAGGYVHVILGNHDIMNLSGDYRYTQAKYFGTAGTMSITYANLFDENTELGRWLRTKNIIEKIGETLYLHGGISPQVMATGKSVTEINELCRPYYAADKSTIPADIKVFFGRNAPFWYRGYFNAPKITTEQFDQILKFYQVSRIAVGHTDTDNIKTVLEGKVIALDVNVHEGKSEAALYENGIWYKVNNKGIKSAL